MINPLTKVLNLTVSFLFGRIRSPALCYLNDEILFSPVGGSSPLDELLSPPGR